MFSKVLIANRGEIALRVARACRELGIRTVAVYSTEDRDSAVVSYADEAVQIGPAPAKRSYLSIPAIVEAALNTGAEAVHPGYGFLSEDADFAEVCHDNGLVFVGPPPEVTARLGDKTAARSLMAGAGLPMLSGSLEPLTSAEQAHRVADDIGYPVIIKAAAGGGGRGMRIVYDSADFLAAYQETRAGALALFGDPQVFVERYLPSGRHVEIQVLADHFGNAIHLGERDCSVQRRHQKLIEESPAPHLPDGIVEEMGQVAVRGALAAGYVGAGTFEFLLDDQGNFSFMEVNCRIQVEHPVTEMITGVDLVQEQLRIAGGQQMTLRQEDVAMRGAAIECRVNVENPDFDFAPTPGVLEEFQPASGPFVRVDTHGYPGYRVPASYDSLLAKLIVWAPSRAAALERMDRALTEFRVRGRGVHTTVEFLRSVLAHPEFHSGHYATTVVDNVLREREPARDVPGAA
ncbi:MULTISPECIES: acetyl-CoA carboxylase biotin carboxylase subunit [unclassified Actinopolyspora]|uniref:acetyl-CoA carboxylase biotin carboxylase subunit n=1 Tax=unclassified Actinopolyspora TaxID=2639451 RepID=UPI0013F5CD48|nr:MULTISPECIES: acetyl-CoA carboxylase biotin carboxylase subunit [unclassified Actinopolyspora]NHD19327.1 acetyl-CoA carboxylase biotin carboxylase subunit [Actinopolyspora sp. BKK2]NHE78451.1 acetyl-CoA carboxylase biotin carboxylase subunit [Actinopolyspora sp. BKK1]